MKVCVLARYSAVKALSGLQGEGMSEGKSVVFFCF